MHPKSNLEPMHTGTCGKPLRGMVDPDGKTFAIFDTKNDRPWLVIITAESFFQLVCGDFKRAGEVPGKTPDTTRGTRLLSRRMRGGEFELTGAPSD